MCYSAGEPISKLQRATVSPLAGWPQRYWILAPRDRAACRDGSACVTGEAVIQAASSANFRRFLTRVCRLANSC